MIKIAAMLFCAIIAGCATTGPILSEPKADLNFIPPGKARIVVFRTTESLLYAGRSAPITIGGKEIGDCYEGSFVYGDAPEGHCVIKTELWDAPGSCETDIDAEAGKEYFFVIKPRTRSFLAGVAGGIIGLAIESSGEKCGGLFSLNPVETEIARKELTGLVPAERWSGVPPERTEK